MGRGKTFLRLGCLALAFASIRAAAQTAAAPDTRAPMEQAAAQQRAAVQAMQAGIAKQRISVQQPAQGQATGFFMLAPPAPFGAPLPMAAAAPTAAASASADCDPLPGSTVDSLVAEAAHREAIDGQVLRSVMQQESAFRPCAVSSKGAMGLMQLMPATAEQYGVRQPFDPSENVGAAAKLLRELLTRYHGDLRLALGAYNAGPAAVDSIQDIPPFPETLGYVNTILNQVSPKR